MRAPLGCGVAAIPRCPTLRIGGAYIAASFEPPGGLWTKKGTPFRPDKMGMNIGRGELEWDTTVKHYVHFIRVVATFVRHFSQYY